MKTHTKARSEMYARSEIKRFHVPDEKVSWSVAWEEYKPTDHTAESVRKMPVWADVDFTTDSSSKPKWNSLDGKINRKSHVGNYVIEDQVPRNPCGRTGIKGRGCLGRWGPNHAADPIVTRWKINEKDQKLKKIDGKSVLEFIAVKRRDNGEWALPGGMVDAGEAVTATLKREFGEEALNSLEASDSEKKQIEKRISDIFTHGKEVYRGYVDDPRNTDNAWMETVAMNFHDEDGTGVAKIKLSAGDDAVGVQWMELSHELSLYASHIHFLEATASLHNAHW